MIKQQKTKPQNFYAKHAQRSGAGTHQVKQGPLASRARQKQNLMKELYVQ